MEREHERTDEPVTEDGEDRREPVPVGAPDPLPTLDARRIRGEVRARLFGEPPETVRVGRFALLHRLGAGGMGVVYVAYDEQLDRKVALKLVRSSAGPGDAEERLLREAQAMARLSHPNVATVHEVGLWDGRVFVAMELVRGETVRAWLAEKPRDVREVLEVFAQAGRGLAAAHEQGLVHRDFKPENVMIGHDGRVRVLDFGLAREAEPPPSDDLDRAPSAPGPQPPELSTAMIAGTPAYMAPEQHRSGKVDARADQWSFCAALFEALYGERPFDGETLDELRERAERGEVRPAPRGTRVPSRLRQAVLRGLAPRPEDRWPSMRALLDELGRDPARRRRHVLLAAGLALAVGGAGTGLWLRDRNACAGAGAKIEEVWGGPRRDAVKKAFDGSGLSYAGDAWARAAGALDGYAAAWATMHTNTCREGRHDRQPRDLIDLRMVCLERRRAELGAAARVLAEGGARVVERSAEVVSGLGPLDACADSAALHAEVRPPAGAETAARVELERAGLAVSRAELSAGHYARSIEHAGAVLAEARRLDYAPLMAEALVTQGAAYKKAGKHPEAIAALEEGFTRALAARHDRVAADAAVQLYTVIGYHQARDDLARPWEQAASALVSRVSEDRRLEADFLNNRGLVRQERGQLAEALADFRRVRVIYEQLFGPRHRSIARTLGNIAAIPYLQGRYDEALGTLREGLAIDEDVNGPDHPEVGRALANLASILIEVGSHDEALSRARRAVSIAERALGPQHDTLALTLDVLGAALSARGELEEALESRFRGLSIVRAKSPPNALRLAVLLDGCGATLHALGRHDEAISRLEEALALREERLGKDHQDVGETLGHLGDALLAKGRLDDAEARFRRALGIIERRLGAEHPGLALPLAGLGRVLLARDDAAAAAPLLDRAERLGGRSPARRGEIRFALARALTSRAASGDEGRARQLCEQAIADLEKAGGSHGRRAAEARAWLSLRAPR